MFKTIMSNFWPFLENINRKQKHTRILRPAVLAVPVAVIWIAASCASQHGTAGGKTDKTDADKVKNEKWEKSPVRVLTVPEGVAVKTVDPATGELKEAGLTPAVIEWYHHCAFCDDPEPVAAVFLEYGEKKLRVIPVDDGTKKMFIVKADFSFSEPLVGKGILYDPEIYPKTEVKPAYPKGEDACDNFIFRYLNYPGYAMKQGIEGKVSVLFVVEQDGSLTNLRILRGIGGGCDEAVLDLIRLMPHWYPGKINGKSVRCRVSMEINFTLGKRNNWRSVYYYR